MSMCSFYARKYLRLSQNHGNWFVGRLSTYHPLSIANMYKHYKPVACAKPANLDPRLVMARGSASWLTLTKHHADGPEP